MNELPPNLSRPGRSPARTKGRMLDDAALAEVRALIAEVPRRDRLIEYLHAIQDTHRHLSAPHLRALAHLLRIGQAEVYEVATFYDHFDVVKEGEVPPPALTIRICDGIACMLAGAERLVAEMEAGVDPSAIRIQRAPCMGGCDVAPAARVGDREVGHADRDRLMALVTAEDTGPARPDYRDLAAYRAEGGYVQLDRIRNGTLTVEGVIAELKDSCLRGLGGAGFVTGKKWELVRQNPGPRLMTVNADEGEPGTFKDRYHMERNPHAMLEGALIGAHCVEAERIYIYMRAEYPAATEIVRREIRALEEARLIDPGYIELRRGAGAYICGEESAMVESIEGNRGLPRLRPPFIGQVGLFGRPTLNNNVETLYWVPKILEKGIDWFRDLGKPDYPGLRSWSVSGRVRNPGVVQAPAGSTANELIEACGGMADGRSFKAFLPGGASGGLLPADRGDVPLDFGGALAKLDAFVGSHAVVIFSDVDNMKDVVLNLIDFFTHESCGQCTPCRGGTQKMAQLLRRDHLDEDAIRDLEQVMRDASICGLGQAAPNPVNHLLTYFRGDL
ncbi:NAD(P)H-dependent oxidoreductase subunit E [Palleronia abyssalis]|uniref:NADH-quinone oxidoreductase subunit F n=1 Tax=Palleronia abyssalis TaxID=1501240 RepID=A0A2R8BYQ5_9RHOB|nr:NAD(P)H-dependent oxidoreductase subunit E [Palleronia abyssalis]SPJ25274.1 NADH-quinone oxidoreductase subunit F [Palleronia abyssalis]